MCGWCTAYPAPTPTRPTPGLTEGEQEEAAKAAEALKEQQGASDDDDDYKQASKVGPSEAGLCGTARDLLLVVGVGVGCVRQWRRL